MSADKQGNKESLKQTFLSFLTKVKSILRDKKSKDLLTFCCFLVLSFLFWIMMSAGEQSQQDYKIPIKYVDLPANTLISNNPPTHINVRLQDGGSTLLKYQFNRLAPIQVSLNNFPLEKGEFILVKSSQLSKQLKEQLEITTSIVSLSPDTIRLYIANNKGKNVSVQPNIQYTIKPQCILNGEVKITPAQVKIYAPKSLLKQITTLRTDTLRIKKELSDSAQYTLKITPIPGVKIEPCMVTVTIPVEELTLKTLTLPIQPTGTPANISLRLFPATARLSIMIPVSQFSQYNVSDLALTVNFANIKGKTQNKKLKIQLQNYIDKKIYNYTIQPDSVEYLIEEKYIPMQSSTETVE